MVERLYQPNAAQKKSGEGYIYIRENRTRQIEIKMGKRIVKPPKRYDNDKLL